MSLTRPTNGRGLILLVEMHVPNEPTSVVPVKAISVLVETLNGEAAIVKHLTSNSKVAELKHRVQSTLGI